MKKLFRRGYVDEDKVEATLDEAKDLNLQMQLTLARLEKQVSLREKKADRDADRR